MNYKKVIKEQQPQPSLLNNAVKVVYKNWRGEIAVRTIVPFDFIWDISEYHPEKQWLLRVWDCGKNAERLYALKDITSWNVK